MTRDNTQQITEYVPSPITTSLRVQTKAHSGSPSAPALSEPSTTPTESWVPAVLGAVILVVYAVFLLIRFEPAIVAADANGYWAQGSLIAQTGRTWFTQEAPPQYVGMHWLVTPEGRFYSRYPAGLPVLIAAVYRTAGPNVAVLINPVLALLTLAGIGLLVGLLVGRTWGVVGMLLLACNPMFARHALQCDSHMAVTAMLTWGLTALVWWSIKGGWHVAFLAGVFLGSIPTIRYPEALFAIGVGIFLLCHWRRPGKWLDYTAAVIGAMVPILPLLIHNQIAFGAFWRTAYALTKEQTGFGLGYFRTNAMHYIESLQGDGLGLLMCPGLLGIGVLCGKRETRPTGLLLALTIIPTTLLYMSYYWAPQHMSAGVLRFLLPTFPCYIVGAMYMAKILCDAGGNGATKMALAIPLAVYMVWGTVNCAMDTRQGTHHRKVLAMLTQKIAENVDDGDVILSGSGLLQHLDFVRKWKLADVTSLRPKRMNPRISERLENSERPSPMQPEKMKRQMEQYAGLGPLALQRTVAEELRTWADGKRVFFVGKPEDLEQMIGWHFGSRQFRIIAWIELPETPVDFRARRQGMGGMPPGQPLADDNGQPDLNGPDFAAAGGLPDRQQPFALGGPMGGRRLAGSQQRRNMLGAMRGPGGIRGGGGPGRMREWSTAREAVIAEWIWQPI